MKLKLFTVPCALLLVLTLFFSACEKEGPAGPAGPAGPQGPAGPTGATGAAGPAGTANVFYSNWLDVDFTPNADSSTWTGQITATRLVDSILAKGEVRVYVNLGTPTTQTIVPLPIDPFLFQLILSPIYQVGKITLISDVDAGTTVDPSQNNQKTLQYRYIIIPGGTAVGGRYAKINWDDYNAVKAYLGLKD